MNNIININFKVTPSQKATIDLRVTENGFDEVSAYLKVVALKTQTFKITSEDVSTQEASIELDFKVSQEQNKKIEESMKESACEDLTTYLKYVALHGVVTSIVEVRSTGNLDAMLQRIADSRPKLKANPLFN